MTFRQSSPILLVMSTPTTSASGGADSTLSAGTIVLYEDNGRALLAVVADTQKSKLSVLNERGRSVDLPAARLLPVPGRMPVHVKGAKEESGFLTTLHESAEKDALAIDLQELWEMLLEDPREYSAGEVADLLFGETTTAKFLLAWCALVRHALFFKRRKSGFEPRPAEVVEELRRAEKVKQEKEAQRQRFLDWAFSRAQTQDLPCPTEAQSVVDSLLAIAAGVPVPGSSQRELNELLERLYEGLNMSVPHRPEKRAFVALSHLGILHRHSNLGPIKYGRPTRFSAAALDESRESAALPVSEFRAPLTVDGRLTVTGRSFTVDDASTRDMDDAISIERNGSDYRIGIHISDVAALIPAGSALDAEARARATSVYLPEETQHMLPEAFSEARASLVAGEERLTMSCFFTVGPDRSVRDVSIVPSLLNVRERWGYDEVDRALAEGEKDFDFLVEVASLLEAERLSRGAVKLSRRDLRISVDDRGTVSLQEVDEYTASRTLIGEFMVFANQQFAEYAKRHSFPLVFRGQEPPDEDIEEFGLKFPEGPAREYNMRGLFKKSITSLSAVPHATLAVDAYAQVTSPIRRYHDLLNQRQLLWHLATGSALYSPTELTELIAACEEGLTAATQIQRETRRYWLLEYLRQQLRQHRDVFEATVLRKEHRFPLVEIDECLLGVVVQTDKSLSVGEKIRIRVKAVDPREDSIRVELAG